MQSTPAWRREPAQYRVILRPRRSGGCLQVTAVRFVLVTLPVPILCESLGCAPNLSPGKDPQRSGRPNPTAPLLLRTEPEAVARAYAGGENAPAGPELVPVSTRETADDCSA